MRTPAPVAIPLLVGITIAAAHSNPAAAQDPTPAGRMPPVPTCDGWGSYNFFDLASADTVAACLRAGADAISPVDERNATPLHHAARATLDPDVIAHLLLAGADVNARNWSGRTPLHEAARRTTNPEIVTALVEGGAEIDARDQRRNTPLHSAWDNPLAGLSREPRLNMIAVEELLRLGADPLARNDRGEVADPTGCDLWNTPVFDEAADFEDFVRCLESGADVAARDYYGNAVLHVAASNEDPARATLLLEAGADVALPNNLGDTPLHVAAALGNLAVATLLLEAGADPNAPNHQGHAPTHHAARHGSVEVMAALLAAGADVNARTKVGNEPLVVAVNERRSIELIDALLEGGADVDAVDERARTPLHWAIQRGGMLPADAVRPPRGSVDSLSASVSSIVSRLLEHGADPNARSDGGGTPLHDAMHAWPVEEVPTLIRPLLAAGADPNARDHGGRSPIHRLALLSGRAGSIGLLVEAGADVNAPDANGATPLHVALGRTWGDSSVVHVLLAHGADAKARNREGDTPLHLATVGLDTTVVAALVRAGADLNARNERGETPLHWAWWRDNPVVVDKLLELGADPNAEDDRGQVAGPVCNWSDVRFRIERAPVESVRTCIEAGTPVDLPAGWSWSTPLHRTQSLFAGGAANEVASLLLAAGAEPNARTDDGRTPLHSAASSGDAPMVGTLLQAGADANARTPDGTTPLHSASGGSRGTVATVSLLVEAGADVDARTELGATPLHWAVSQGNHEVAARLLELGADREARDDFGRVADPLSCEHFNNLAFFALATADAVAGCIAAGADVNARLATFRGVNARPRSTPLHLAVRATRDAALVSLLLEAGADVHARNDNGYTALHHAARYGTPEMVRALLRGGAAVDARALGFSIHYGWDWTPLHLAVVHNPDPEVSAALLEAGADPRARGYEGETPIHMAARNGNPALAALLLDTGADANARGSTGRTPLHDAATSNGNPAMIAVLLDAGAELEARAVYPDSHWDYGSMTPLHEAARANGNPAIVTALIEAGADVDARVLAGAIPFQLVGAAGMVRPEQRGATSLHIAALLNGSSGVTAALVRGGAELEMRDQFGRTALHVAAQGMGNAVAFLELLELGADPAALDGEGRTPIDYARENVALQGLEAVTRGR